MWQRAWLCVALLILLSGCRMVKEPPPAPSLTVSPAPTSRMTATPTPSNEDRLKGGEDVYLYLDEQTDLLTYTSYALLQTPPEQVERYVRCSLDHLKMELFCGEMTSILIFDADKEPQELSVKIDYHFAGIGDLTAEDVNFDGFPDLRFFIGGDRGGQSFYAALLWEPETEAYVYAPAFAEISSPRLDPAHKVIWGGCDYSYGCFYYAWEFVDGEFIKTHSLIGDYSNWAQGTGEQCTEYAWINGVEVEVGRQEFPGEALSGAVAAYIEHGPVWEGWSWCDPHVYEIKG